MTSLLHLAELEDIRDILTTINDNSTIVITSSETDELDFELEEISKNEYKLYISSEVKILDELFNKNKKVKKIMFDNWDSSNITSLMGAFANMILDEFPNFSKQDFSSIENLSHLFENTKVKGNCEFKSDTLQRLEKCYHMFLNFQCDNLIVDLGKNSLTEGWNMFNKAKLSSLKFILNHTYLSGMMAGLFMDSEIDFIDLSEWHLWKKDCITNFLNNTISKKVILPETTTDFAIGSTSDKIDKIYCNKAWEKQL